MSISIKNDLNLIDHLQKTQKDMGATAAALVILQKGRVISEWYSGSHSSQEGAAKVSKRSQFPVASIRKTYIAYALANALFHRKISSIDDEVSQYLTELKDPVFKGISIRHLLTHTHGLSEQDNQVIKRFKAGSNWHYNNTGIQLLVKLVEKTTGKSVSEILQSDVFHPLNFSETGWRTEKDKHLIVNVQEESDVLGPYDSPRGDQSNLFTSARELAFWGNLFLQKGNVNGIQLLNEEMFDELTVIQTPESLPEKLPRQGFLWWVQGEKNFSSNEIGERVPKGSYQVLGYTGCACLVIPKFNVVAVRMFNQTGDNQQPHFDYLREMRAFGNRVTDCFNNCETNFGVPLEIKL